MPMDRGQNVDRVGAGAGGAPEAAGETPGDTAPRKSSKTKQVVWTVILVILAVGPGLFGVKIYRATSYKRYILAGEKAVAEKRWDNAPTAFRRAMTVQGYAESEEARKALLGIDAAEQKHHYETALAQGNEALSAGSFDNASQAFHRALSVEGFGQSPEPIAGLEKLFETRFGMAREAAGHREVPNIDMVFVLVSEGRFEMGTGGTRHQDGPVHTVTITRPFWVGACEVTQAQFQTVMENNPSRTKGESHPVDQVTFGNAVEFCAKLTEQERGAGRLPQGYVYRLPTEAEWAYAARGGPASKRVSTKVGFCAETRVLCARARKGATSTYIAGP